MYAQDGEYKTNKNGNGAGNGGGGGSNNSSNGASQGGQPAAQSQPAQLADVQQQVGIPSRKRATLLPSDSSVPTNLRFLVTLVAVPVNKSVQWHVDIPVTGQDAPVLIHHDATCFKLASHPSSCSATPSGL